MRKIENGERIVANVHTAGFKPFVAGGRKIPDRAISSSMKPSSKVPGSLTLTGAAIAVLIRQLERNL